MSSGVRLFLHYFGFVLGMSLFMLGVCTMAWFTIIPLMAALDIPLLSASSKFFLSVGFLRYYLMVGIVWLLTALVVDTIKAKMLAKRVEEKLFEEPTSPTD